MVVPFGHVLQPGLFAKLYVPGGQSWHEGGAPVDQLHVKSAGLRTCVLGEP